MNARSIIKRFGTARALADAIGVSESAVHKWRQRDYIPGEYDTAIVTAATAAGLSVSFEDLAVVRARRLDEAS